MAARTFLMRIECTGWTFSSPLSVPGESPAGLSTTPAGVVLSSRFFWVTVGHLSVVGPDLAPDPGNHPRVAPGHGRLIPPPAFLRREDVTAGTVQFSLCGESSATGPPRREAPSPP